MFSVEDLPPQLCFFTLHCRYTVIHEFPTCSLQITFFKPLKIFPKSHWKKLCKYIFHPSTLAPLRVLILDFANRQLACEHRHFPFVASLQLAGEKQRLEISLCSQSNWQRAQYVGCELEHSKFDKWRNRFLLCLFLITIMCLVAVFYCSLSN